MSDLSDEIEELLMCHCFDDIYDLWVENECPDSMFDWLQGHIVGSIDSSTMHVFNAWSALKFR